MNLYRLERTQILPISQEKAWQFFSRPQNLPEITPPWLGFKMKNYPQTELYAGQVFSYRLKPLWGIKVTWISEITHVQEPEYFVDEQRFGPYRFWHHRHVFEPVDDGTRVHDCVHYAIGYGITDRWIQRMIVGPRLVNIFNYRQNSLKNIFDPNIPKRDGRLN